MNTKAKGAAIENAVASELRADGWVYKGTGDAHGTIDGIALKRGHRPLAVQTKGSSRKRGAFADFGPLERALCEQEAERAGWPEYVDLRMAWKPAAGAATVWFAPSEWPGQ